MRFEVSPLSVREAIAAPPPRSAERLRLSVGADYFLVRGLCLRSFCSRRSLAQVPS
jgi:hypothetical protein